MIVATRLLEIRAEDAIVSVPVRLHVPECTDGMWTCRYEIDWPEGRRSSFAAGCDAIQALHLALQKTGIELYASVHHAAGTLVWQRPGDGYGFPVPRNARDMLIGSDERFEG